MKFYPNYSLAAYAGDKATVHDYLEEKGLKKYEVPIIGIYDNPNEINWDEIPNKFVVKKSNACGMNIVITDKKSIDIGEIERSIDKWISRDFGKEVAEFHYCKMKPKIVVEKFMEDIEKEYQFYTFNGVAKSLQIMAFQIEYCAGKISEGKEVIGREYFNIDDFKEINSMSNLNELIDVAEKIGVDFPLARVDFFLSEGNWYIGEITLTPSGGFNTLSNVQQEEWGDWLELPCEQ